MMDFDPKRHVRFRGKALNELTHQETLAALVQALERVAYLEATRPLGVRPSMVPTEGPTKPIPFPSRTEFYQP
ncbi:hypothetical protein ACQKQD_18235 [Methylobacterium sp. NPDC080182]|uniref:hypothetical protein n=1 Tax=Methylobacterium sp. NPDC080182 TaxID=3390590 RepID=UPI003D059F95